MGPFMFFLHGDSLNQFKEADQQLMISLKICLDGQEPHDGNPGAVSVAAEGKENHGSIHGKSVWLLLARNLMTASVFQFLWLQGARNAMAASLVKSVLLQMARNPMVDTLVQLVQLQMASNAMVDTQVQSV